MHWYEGEKQDQKHKKSYKQGYIGCRNSVGEVVRVAPVVGTVPLFTVLLSTVLLRGVEQITPRIVVASLLVVVGVVSIHFGS